MKYMYMYQYGIIENNSSKKDMLVYNKLHTCTSSIQIHVLVDFPYNLNKNPITILFLKIR